LFTKKKKKTKEIKYKVYRSAVLYEVFIINIPPFFSKEKGGRQESSLWLYKEREKERKRKKEKIVFVC